MARLTWDASEGRFYESGVDRGVLYVPSQPGVAWVGLISVEESPTGGEARPFYMDGIKYLNVAGGEEYVATIAAISAPPEFGPCDGNVMIQNGLIATAQPRRPFGFCYRTLIGDASSASVGYKLHLVYNALAQPSARNNNTLSDSASPNSYSWAISTVPSTIPNRKPTAHMIVDSRYSDPDDLAYLEEVLYGTAEDDPRLPTAGELVSIFA